MPATPTCRCHRCRRDRPAGARRPGRGRRELAGVLRGGAGRDSPRCAGTTFTLRRRRRPRSENRGPDDLGYQPRDVAYPHDLDAGTGRATARRRSPATGSRCPAPSCGRSPRSTVATRADVLVSAEYRTRVVRQALGGRPPDLHRAGPRPPVRPHQHRPAASSTGSRARTAARPSSCDHRRHGVRHDRHARVRPHGHRRRRRRAPTSSWPPTPTPARCVELRDPESTTRRRTPAPCWPPSGWIDMRSVGRTASCMNARVRTLVRRHRRRGRGRPGPAVDRPRRRRTARARTSCRAASSRPTGSRWPTATEPTPSALARSAADHGVRVGSGVDRTAGDEDVGAGLGAPLDRLQADSPVDLQPGLDAVLALSSRPYGSWAGTGRGTSDRRSRAPRS